MVIKALLRIRHPGCYTEVIQGKARVVQLTAGPGMSLLSISAGSSEQVDHIVKTFAAVNGRPFEIVERAPTQAIIRFKICERGIVRDILASGASVLWPAIHRDGHEHYTILVNNKRALATVLHRLADRGEVKVEKTTEMDAAAISAPIPFQELIEDLTPKQLSVILLAIDQGYYRTPRRADSRDLAAQLGVNRSTLVEHLRKAEARILARMASAIDDQPAVRSAATRKMGRPPGPTSVPRRERGPPKSSNGTPLP